MKAFGSQLIAEFLDCEAFEQLSHTAAVHTLLSEGLAQAKMDLRELACHQFEPVGVTAVAIIGESHVALHTYPETRHLAVDIFTCSPGSNKPQALLDFLKERLRPQQVRQAEIMRGHTIALQEQDVLTDFSKSAYDIRYHVSATLFQTRSPWQEIRIIDNPCFGRMLFLDQELQIAESDGVYHQTLLPEHSRPLRQAAILGGGDGGALKLLLKHWPQLETVFVLERDKAVIEAAQTHLPRICGQGFAAPQVKVIEGDAALLLTDLHDLDLIIADLGTAPWSQTGHPAEQYLPALFAEIQRALAPEGTLSLSLCPVADTQARLTWETNLRSCFPKLQLQEVFVPSFCEFWLFAQGQK